MADRTKEQLLDEMVYAVQCVFYHYGPALSEDGLKELRAALAKFGVPNLDSDYRVFRLDDEPYIDENIGRDINA